MVSVLAKELGLPTKAEGLMQLRKSDSRKVVCAALIKSRTAEANGWIAQRLAMGHPASMRQNPKAARQLKTHQKALKPKD
jgi:hypothetical protein